MPYLNVDQVESAITALATANRTTVTQIFLPNKTSEQRTCSALRVAAGNTRARPSVYFLGGVHAREWGSSDILVAFCQRLTAAYQQAAGITIGTNNFTADDIAHIVRDLDIIVFPQANPDGRNFSMTVDAMWRKNRRPPDLTHPDCFGVDINRNYWFLWNYPQYFSSAAAVRSSTDPCNETYIGPGAQSEPETNNIVWLMDQSPRVGYFIDLHSFSEDILVSWGDDENQSTDPDQNFGNPNYHGRRGAPGDAYGEYLPEVDDQTGVNLASGMRDAIAGVRGHQYLVEQSFQLYPTSGASDDYFYSRHFSDPNKGKVITFVIEWGSPSNDTPFHPEYSEMRQIIDEMVAGLLRFCLDVLALPVPDPTLEFNFMIVRPGETQTPQPPRLWIAAEGKYYTPGGQVNVAFHSPTIHDPVVATLSGKADALGNFQASQSGGRAFRFPCGEPLQVVAVDVASGLTSSVVTGEVDCQ